VYFHGDEKYLPASFEYIATHGVLLDNGKAKYDKLTQISDIRSQVRREITKSGNPELIWNGKNIGKPSMMLHTGDREGSDGYSGPPDDKNPKYGDPHKPTQIITAHCLGEWISPNGVRFADVCYCVYFMWNGTSHFHAADMEEIVLRMQYFPTRSNMSSCSGDASGYDSCAESALLSAQGNPNPSETWAVVRAYLSCHGNGMWYPTRFPGQSTTHIEFDGSHPVFYAGRGSHAMYPTAGRQKRIFGFGDDVTRADFLWKPTHVSFWFGTGSPLQSTGPYHTILNVSETPGKTVDVNDPILYLAYFNGTVGNADNNQRTVPFKNGVMNLVTKGDFYYKFQMGGTDSAVRVQLSHKTQTRIGMVAIIAALFLLVGIVYVNSDVLDVLAAVLVAVAVSLLVLVIVLGNGSIGHFVDMVRRK
tara:strand:+ start:537 stop:1790 length:1254 start_codon:yes stop_codon:yes gene_type:complete